MFFTNYEIEVKENKIVFTRKDTGREISIAVSEQKGMALYNHIKQYLGTGPAEAYKNKFL